MSPQYTVCRPRLGAFGARGAIFSGPFCAAALAAMSLVVFQPGSAEAQAKLDAAYRVTLAGVAIGTGTMTLDVAGDRYTLSGNGRAVGLMRAMGGGTGEVTVRGTIAGKKLASASYAHTIESSKKLQAIKMQLVSGLVKQLSVLPPVEPTPNVIAITDAHKRGVIDPLSAGIIPAAGSNGVGPEACAQKLPVFDGRLRYDLTLAYKRQEPVRAEGYEGLAVVCGVRFEPLGGHNKEKFAIRFLRENRDMEIWFAPVAGTPFLTFFRIFVPTLLGPGVMQATRFVATGTSRAGALGAQVR